MASSAAPSGNVPGTMFQPSWARRLADPSIRNVFVAGCGGGFDFVHGTGILVPELKRLGKNVVIGSYSFGDPNMITNAEKLEGTGVEGGTTVKKVTAASTPDRHYGPEVHCCSYLDERFPADAPHFMYAYYARAFCVPTLHRLYGRWVAEHDIDAIVIVDGGSDSLMSGDENGLGDPVEDCVSVTTVSMLENVRCKILLTVGMGCDRFNDVSDASSLRAVAELTKQRSFLGALSMEPGTPVYDGYNALVEHIWKKQGFRSVLAESIVCAGRGSFGLCIPEELSSRVREGELYLWPLMSVVWGFDIDGVVRRSRMAAMIRQCPTPLDCEMAIENGRDPKRRGSGSRVVVREVEELPRHVDFCPSKFRWS